VLSGVAVPLQARWRVCVEPWCEGGFLFFFFFFFPFLTRVVQEKGTALKAGLIDKVRSRVRVRQQRG